MAPEAPLSVKESIGKAWDSTLNVFFELIIVGFLVAFIIVPELAIYGVMGPVSIWLKVFLSFVAIPPAFGLFFIFEFIIPIAKSSAVGSRIFYVVARVILALFIGQSLCLLAIAAGILHI